MEHLNAGIDEKCLILLGKLFCAVMTLRTKDLYSVQAKGPTRLV